jgi:alpha-beta hydrolase superfamily lysophospholipase
MPPAFDSFSLQSADGAQLAAFRMPPSGGPVRGVVQIAHGMAEHSRRYERLAARLAAAGYATYAADHRGHGGSARIHGLGDFGPGGFAAVVADMAVLSQLARADNPGAPLILLGHSMGSFAAQAYLPEHGAQLAALVLSGTAALPPLLQAMAAAANVGRLEAFNAAFEPARTPFDWLSRDEAEVDAYIADPMCGFEVAEASRQSMFALGLRSPNDPRLSGLRSDLPILILSGEVDPVVGPGQSHAVALIDAWRGRGLGRIEHRVYAGARHELFNETCRDQVTADLIAWLGAIPALAR